MIWLLLDATAALAAIATAIVAIWAWAHYRYQRRDSRLRVERYLRAEKEWGIDQGQRTVQHLIANLGMTEKEVLDAAFRSKTVRRLTRSDERGFADILLFEYDDHKLDEELIRRRNRKPPRPLP